MKKILLVLLAISLPALGASERSESPGAVIIPSGQTIQAVATNANAVNYTINGTPFQGTVEQAPTFPQGRVPSTVGVIYTVPTGYSFDMSSLMLTNTTAIPQPGVILYVGGSAAVNQITGSLTIPAYGNCTFVANAALYCTDATGSFQTASQGGITSLIGGTGINITGGNTINLSNPVAVTLGGTHLATLTAHGLLTGEGTGDPTFVAPAATGTLLLGQGITSDPSFAAMSGDCTITNAGAIACAKSGGVAFGTMAFQNANAVAITGGVAEFTSALTSQVSTTGVGLGTSTGIPQFYMVAASAGTDLKYYDWISDNAGVLHGRMFSDSFGTHNDWIAVSRSTATPTTITLGGRLLLGGITDDGVTPLQVGIGGISSLQALAGTSAEIRGNSLGVNVTNPTTSTATVEGMFISATNASSAANNGSIVGLTMLGYQNGAGSINNLYGGNFNLWSTGAGNVALGAALNINPPFLSSSGTFAFMIGLQIGAQYNASFATNAWGIRQIGANDRNWFAGRTLIGSSNTDNGVDAVQISGSASLTGRLLDTNIVAPATPASGFTQIYVDSTSKNLAAKNDAGTVNHGAQTIAATSNNFLTALNDAGAFTAAQPSFANLSGSATCAQLPALTGSVTSSAGSCGTTVVTNANLTGPVTSVGNATTITSTITAGGPTGSATVAPIITYNAAGQLTTVTSATITPAIGSVTGLGTGVSTALGTNVGTAGAFVVNGGALGTPSSGTLTNATGLPATGLTGTLQAAQFPALTGDTTTTAGSLTTTTGKVNGVSYPASPSTNTIPLVTGANTVTYSAAAAIKTVLAILSTDISDFATAVRATVLTGLSLVTNTSITSSDTVLSALGKLQAQISVLFGGNCYATAQAGATADVQINACNTALTALGGGTIDARGYGPTTQSIVAAVSVGDASGHPVTLMLDRSTQYNVTVTGGSGVDAIHHFIRSSIVVVGMGNPLVANFVVQATTNVNAIIASYPRVSQWVGMIQGVVIEGNPSATVLSEYDISGATALARLMDIGAYNFNGNGLKISNNASASVDSLICDNCSFDGVGSTTGCPVLIDGTGASTPLVGVSFIGGTIVHPGASCASHAMIDIEGGASDTTQGVHIYSTRFESSNTTDIGVLINNALNIDIIGASASANVNNGADVVKITATANVSYNINIQNLGQFNAWTNSINDVVNGVTKSGAAFPRITAYIVMPPTNGAYQIQQGVVTMRPPRTCKLIADSGGSASATLASITWANSCVFQVDASTTYRFECDVLSTSTNVAGGLFMGITGPASPVASTYQITQQKTAPATFNSTNLAQTTTYQTTGTGVVGQTITTVFPAHFSGTFENGTTAGTLSMQWANGSATGSLVLKRGSACTVY